MPPRVAFFPDSFHEVNGVAHTARHFVDFARRHDLPMLCVRAGSAGNRLTVDGSVQTLEIDRGHWSVRLEQDLSFDPFFIRHTAAVHHALRDFRPDIVHITGPSEMGLLGASFARWLEIDLAASWHTNVHEYAGRRLTARTPRLGRHAASLGALAERGSLTLVAGLYSLAKVLFAPNPGLCAILSERTGRPCHLMQRGVDTTLFFPRRSPLSEPGRELILGYVGRLSVEKNVSLLPVLQQQLRTRSVAIRWLIVGHGAEERSLRQGLGAQAEFTGVLRGQALADAYRRMDLLVFPSHTDTFGNVVLEALASGVPALVTPDGGPAHIVQHTLTGIVAPDDHFAESIAALASDPNRLQTMAGAARQYALDCSWDEVFRKVIAAYPARYPPLS